MGKKIINLVYHALPVLYRPSKRLVFSHKIPIIVVWISNHYQ